MDQRQALQRQFDSLREKHEEERKNLLRDLSRIIGTDQDKASYRHVPETLTGKFKEAANRKGAGHGKAPDQRDIGSEAGPGFEPEI
jgi:hypothetical protein